MTRHKNTTTTDSRAQLDSQVSESQLQRDVLDLAARLGYLANHNYDSRKSGPDAGFPDAILAKDGRVIAIEFKTERGRVRASQQNWLATLAGPMECYVFRPHHWSSGEIERVLMGTVKIEAA